MLDHQEERSLWEAILKYCGLGQSDQVMLGLRRSLLKPYLQALLFWEMAFAAQSLHKVTTVKLTVMLGLRRTLFKPCLQALLF
jgi:hypothetical protein